MKGLTKWVKDAFVKVVDPDREERVQYLTRLFRAGLKEKRQEFSLHSALFGARAKIDFSDRDLEEAKERVYRGVLVKFWQDEQLSDSERKMAKWVARCLELSNEEAKGMNLRAARTCFSAA